MGAVASGCAHSLALIERTEVARAVRQHAAERAAKGFGCGDHVVAMLFCQMGSAHSLREICGGVATAGGQRGHRGIRRTPPRSTLASAHAHRPWQLVEPVFARVLGRGQALAATTRRRCRVTNPLRTLDTTIIERWATVLDWARFQRPTGALTLPLPLDHQGGLPCWALVTAGDGKDVRGAQTLTFAPGTIVALDRGDLDSALSQRWTVTDVGVVTRPRTNMLSVVLERRPVLSDAVIRLTSPHAADRCTVPRRPVTIWDETPQRPLTFLTHLMPLAASTIAAI